MLLVGGTLSEPHAGDLVTPKLRLVKPLGAGGMGSVWLADHLALHVQVVVKFIAEALAKNKDAIARFEREAAAAAQVKSPHVVQILDHGIGDDGTPFIVMSGGVPKTTWPRSAACGKLRRSAWPSCADAVAGASAASVPASASDKAREAQRFMV